MARSSVEAELRSITLGICEGLWIKMILEELRMKIQGPICTYCDNKATISVSHNLIHHDMIKLVEIDTHFVKEKVDEGTLNIRYIPSVEQIADILTKALFRPSFKKLVVNLWNVQSVQLEL